MQWVRIAKCLFPGQLLKRCDGTFGYTSFPYKCPNIMWASLGHLKLPLVFCRDRKQLVAIMGLLVPTMIQLMMMTESPRIAIHLCLVFYHVDSVKEHERRPYIMFFFNLPGQLGGVIRGCWRMAHGWGLLAKFCFLKPLICMKRILYVQINANIYIYIFTHMYMIHAYKYIFLLGNPSPAHGTFFHVQDTWLAMDHALQEWTVGTLRALGLVLGSSLIIPQWWDKARNLSSHSLLFLFLPVVFHIDRCWSMNMKSLLDIILKYMWL